MRTSRLAVVVLVFATVGCSRLGLERDATSEDGGPSGADVGSDVVIGDVAVDAVPGDDAPVAVDATPSPDAALPPVPPIPTPERSTALDALYCGLDNGQLVAAALRAGACLDVPPAGILNEAARGFVFGEMMTSGYYPVTYGNCELLLCLARATDCDAAAACNEARIGEPCGDYERVCDGDELRACIWTGEETRMVAVQNCERMGGRCEDRDVDGRPQARCVGAPPTGDCGFYGQCDGDIARRCTDPFGDGEAAAFDVDCAELVDGGTCVETAVGGEAPGPTCLPADYECTPSFAEGFECLDDSRMNICLFGRIVELDCADYGYSTCGRGDAFFTTRCLP